MHDILFAIKLHKLILMKQNAEEDLFELEINHMESRALSEI